MKIIDIYDNGGYESAPDMIIADRLRLMAWRGTPVGAVRRRGMVADILADTRGVEVATTGFSFGSRLSLPYKVRRLIGEADTVIINAHSMRLAEQAVLISRSIGSGRVKTVLELQSGMPVDDTPSARFTLDGIDGMIFHCAADRDMFSSPWASDCMSEKAVTVIPPGISLPETIKESDTSKELILVWGGRVTADCGLIKVIEAMGMTHHTPIKLIVAGQGTAKSAVPVLKRVKALGLSERVDFLGNEALTPDRIKEADAMVIPSPMSDDALENGAMAMASGVPLILAEDGRMHQLGQDEVNALFYNPADPESLTAVMRRMAEDTGLRHEMGKAARAKAEAQYDLRFHLDKILDFYSSLLV